ncbi:MAG TPA: DUF2384 domain-containing protein [Trueperaceae bacterium]|nr:DUF2384 domain-containing protein [Trueperaceae bacterium]
MTLAALNLDKQVEAIYDGYDFGQFVKLADTLGISQLALAKHLSISSSTLDRRRQKKFSFQESNRMYELEHIYNKALNVIGDPIDTQTWLKSDNTSLGTSPLELLKTAPGKEAVLIYLEQIARGIIL